LTASRAGGAAAAGAAEGGAAGASPLRAAASTGGASSAPAGAAGGAPAWAQRLKREQTVTRGVAAAEQVVRSGDRPSGGHQPDLSEED